MFRNNRLNLKRAGSYCTTATIKASFTGIGNIIRLKIVLTIFSYLFSLLESLLVKLPFSAAVALYESALKDVSLDYQNA